MDAPTPKQIVRTDESGPIRRLALIGLPVAHSRSPAMQQAALDALGIPARYELWETTPEQLPARVVALRDPEMLGANVTIPYKAAVVPLLDAIAPAAQRASGVVNTIVCELVREETPVGIRLVGHNTDVVALSRILHEEAQWSQAGRSQAGRSQAGRSQARRAVVLGAGGAARAAIAAAREHGAEVYVASRRVEAAAEALADCWRREHATGDAADQGSGAASGHMPALPALWRARALALDDTNGLADALREADVLFQATSVGMSGTAGASESPIPLGLLAHLPAHALVFDLVYIPRETSLVRAARVRGLRASGGLSMLLYQGAAAFTLWTGRPAPLDVMRNALGL